MSSVIELLAAVYGGSMVVVAGAAILHAWSPRFRRSLFGDRPTF